jgi:hypothetical protein
MASTWNEPPIRFSGPDFNSSPAAGALQSASAARQAKETDRM